MDHLPEPIINWPLSLVCAGIGLACLLYAWRMRK